MIAPPHLDAVLICWGVSHISSIGSAPLTHLLSLMDAELPGSQQIWPQLPALLLVPCITLDKSLKISLPASEVVFLFPPTLLVSLHSYFNHRVPLTQFVH